MAKQAQPDQKEKTDKDNGFENIRAHARKEQKKDNSNESWYQHINNTTINIENGEFGGGFFNQFYKSNGRKSRQQDHQKRRNYLDHVDVIDETEISLVYQVFQPPTAYERARSQLDMNKFVILKGGAGIGKRTAAVRLMIDRYGIHDSTSIYELEHGSDLLKTLGSEVLQAGRGFIVDGLHARQSNALTARQWQRLSNRIRKANCSMIVTLPPSVQLPADMPNGVICPIHLPEAESAEIVREHLYHFAHISQSNIDDEAIDTLLEQPEIKSLLESRLFKPAKAASLATSLWTHLDNDTPLDEAITEFLVQDNQDISKWFEDFGLDENVVTLTPQVEIEERALRITLALFNGIDYSHFRLLQRELRRQLFSLFNVPAHPVPKKEKEEAPIQLPFGKNGRNRSALQRAQAELRMIAMPTKENVYSRLRVVSLKNSSFRSKLLYYLWENDDYAAVFDLLVDWLRQLGGHQEYIYRIFAADAVAEIARFDSRLVINKILKPWIRAKRAPERTAVSRVFGTLVHYDEQTNTILNWLASWSKATGDPHYMWAAIRAYSRVGLRFPGLAMQQWHAILDRLWKKKAVTFEQQIVVILINQDHDQMVQSLLDSMQTLFAQALRAEKTSARTFNIIFRVLCQWIEQPQNANTKPLAIYAFLALTALRQPTETSEAESNQQPPTLLYLVDPEQPNSEYVKNVATLLNMLLADKKLKRSALDLLHDWLKFVNLKRIYKPNIKTLLQALTELPQRNDREVRRLCIYLRRWSQRSSKRLPIAGELMVELGLQCSPELIF